MNALLLGVITVLMTAQIASASTVLGCEKKDADPVFCQNGKRRAVCIQDGYMVWADTRVGVMKGQAIFLRADGPLPVPPCPPFKAK